MSALHSHEWSAWDHAGPLLPGYAKRTCECGAQQARVTSLWPCLSCGARNRLRDTTCRHCGDPKPEA